MPTPPQVPSGSNPTGNINPPTGSLPIPTGSLESLANDIKLAFISGSSENQARINKVKQARNNAVNAAITASLSRSATEINNANQYALTLPGKIRKAIQSGSHIIELTDLTCSSPRARDLSGVPKLVYLKCLEQGLLPQIHAKRVTNPVTGQKEQILFIAINTHGKIF